MGARIIIVVFIPVLIGCKSLPTPSQPPTKPLLDSSLAKPCAPLSNPVLDDFDAWLDSYIQLVRDYADCAVRHRKTVEAWPK